MQFFLLDAWLWEVLNSNESSFLPYAAKIESWSCAFLWLFLWCINIFGVYMCVWNYSNFIFIMLVDFGFKSWFKSGLSQIKFYFRSQRSEDNLKTQQREVRVWWQPETQTKKVGNPRSHQLINPIARPPLLVRF